MSSESGAYRLAYLTKHGGIIMHEELTHYLHKWPRGWVNLYFLGESRYKIEPVKHEEVA